METPALKETLLPPPAEKQETPPVKRDRFSSLLCRVILFAQSLLCLFMMGVLGEIAITRFQYQVLRGPDVYCREYSIYISMCSKCRGENPPKCDVMNAIETYYLCKRQHKYDMDPIELYLLPEDLRREGETYEHEVKMNLPSKLTA